MSLMCVASSLIVCEWLSQILGLSEVPVAGDEFEIVDSLEKARSKASEHAEVMRNSRLVAQAGEGKVTLHSFANAVAASAETGVERHQLNVVLKVDAQVCSELCYLHFVL